MTITKSKTVIVLLLLTIVVFTNHAQTKRSKETTTDQDYLEIPKEFFNQPLLLINRISGYPNKLYYYGSSGMDVDYSAMIQLEIEEQHIKIIQHQYQIHSNESDIITGSVAKNHFDPIIAYIPISSSSQISVTIAKNWFERDTRLLSPVSQSRINKYELTPLASNSIRVNHTAKNAQSFQISRTLNYTAGKSIPGHHSDYVSVEQLLVFRKLPNTPMKPRKWDPRVGNFYLSHQKYSSDKAFIEDKNFLEKWRLEPVDTAAYFSGLLSDPKQPIVFYFDENVPLKWRPYIKQGILDWLPVFEKNGFKNAIEVHNKPEDATWDDNDPNYNMIRWVASEIKDAQGNYVSDPRTGEILNGTLTWYQNYFSIINDEYFVNTAAVDPSARNPILPETVFGKIMRETMAHEMGHALGLGHNMIASSAYPTDSLRSQTFLNQHALSPSIMDYASYNFIAQPEDMPLPLTRSIGPYDYWAIEYAYRYLRPSSTTEMEVAFNNNEINERLSDTSLSYMEQEYPTAIDPTNLTGDLGDDPFLSGSYALKNLKKIMANLMDWSLPENNDPAIAISRYQTIINRLNGIYRTVIMQAGGRITRFADTEFSVKTTETKCTDQIMDFLASNLFNNTDWLYNRQIEELSNEISYLESLEELQNKSIKGLLNQQRLERMIAYDIKNNTSTTASILRWLGDQVLKNHISNVPLSVQKSYVNEIEELINETENLVLIHLLKEESTYISETILMKLESEDSDLLKGFYTELIDAK